CKSLLPDLVTMLTMPPRARPYSAPKLLLTTRNSLTASCDGVARCDPVAVLMLSAPSTVTLLFRSRCPPKEMRVTVGSVKGGFRPEPPVGNAGAGQAKIRNQPPAAGQRWDLCRFPHLKAFGGRGPETRRFPPHVSASSAPANFQANTDRGRLRHTQTNAG